MNPDLAQLLTKLNQSKEVFGAEAADDRRRTALIDALAELNSQQILDLVDAIGEQITAARGGQAEERILAELTMLGWSTAIETLRERLRQQNDLPDA